MSRVLFLGLVPALSLLASCSGTPDPRTVEGTLGYMAQAVEAGDARMLFRVVDSRARHAMISIVADRHRAAELVRRTYPTDQRDAALAALGDAADASDAPALFAHRCGAPCMQGIGALVGPPANVRTAGQETFVRTSKGTEIVLFRKNAGDWYGFVWRTAELAAERDRANRDLHVIEENAATYERRRQLEQQAPATP
ncbi:MAG: hypothetical protein U0230_24750 [Polyangiales bacterium]